MAGILGKSRSASAGILGSMRPDFSAADPWYPRNTHDVALAEDLAFKARGSDRRVIGMFAPGGIPQLPMPQDWTPAQQAQQAGMGIGPGAIGIAAAVPDRIRQAYFNVTEGRVNEPVALIDIRGQLKGVPREAVDAALRKMHLEEGTHLSGLDNPRDRTQAMEEGALDFKGERKYILRIGR